MNLCGLLLAWWEPSLGRYPAGSEGNPGGRSLPDSTAPRLLSLLPVCVDHFSGENQCSFVISWQSLSVSSQQFYLFSLFFISWNKVLWWNTMFFNTLFFTSRQVVGQRKQLLRREGDGNCVPFGFTLPPILHHPSSRRVGPQALGKAYGLGWVSWSPAFTLRVPSSFGIQFEVRALRSRFLF